MPRSSMFAPTLALAALLATARPAHADGFDPRDLDKQTHMAASYGITLTVAAILRHYDVPRWQAAAIAVATTAVIGTGKELLDPPYSWGDQLANSIGSASAVVVVFTFRL